MTGFDVVSNRILILSLMGLIGYLASKTGLVESKHRSSLSKVIVNILLPCLIISSVTSKELNSELLGELLIVFVMSVCCVVGMFFFGSWMAHLLRIPEPTATIHRLMLALGNVIFLGYPVIVAMFGESAFIYCIVYWLFNDSFLWTVGVFLLSKNNEKQEKSSLRYLVNPNTVSFVVGLLMLFLGIRLPDFLFQAVEGIGSMTTNLSMIFIGMALSTVAVRKVFCYWWIFIISIFKLVLIPILLIFLFHSIGINPVLYGVVVLELAMPAQTVLAILAYEHNCDPDYAAIGMFVTTLISIITLPLICYLLEEIPIFIAKL